MPGPAVLSLARKLSKSEPTPGSVRFASVAVILRGVGPSILLIKRAERDGDPWSGQVAFPGGKMQSGDGSVRETAVRETKEEVGFDLNESASFLGYLGPFRTHTGNMDVVPSIFTLEKEVAVKLNGEVSSYRWVDFGVFENSLAGGTHQVVREGATLDMPAVVFEDYVVWGLTYRILQSIVENIV